MTKSSVKKLITLFFVLFFGASLGAFLRSNMVMLCANIAFPLGILLTNMLGSFLLGLFYSKPQEKYSCKTIFTATAFLGTLTTFSAFIQDIFLIILIRCTKFFSFALSEQSYQNIINFAAAHPYSTLNFSHAFFIVCLNIVLCLFCVYLGKKRGFIRSDEKPVQ